VLAAGVPSCSAWGLAGAVCSAVVGHVPSKVACLASAEASARTATCQPLVLAPRGILEAFQYPVAAVVPQLVLASGVVAAASNDLASVKAQHTGRCCPASA